MLCAGLVSAQMPAQTGPVLETPADQLPAIAQAGSPGSVLETPAGSDGITVSKIRVITPHCEYVWTETDGIAGEAGVVHPAGSEAAATGAMTPAGSEAGGMGVVHPASIEAGATGAIHSATGTTGEATAASAVVAGLRPSTVLSWTAFYPGRRMTLANFEREVRRTEKRLVDSGLFYSVSVHVVPPRRKPLERTVVITVSDGFYNRFSGGNAFAMYGRKALGGTRAEVSVYAGWNLFGVEAAHENLGNRGFILETAAFSHDFLPSVCDADGAEPRNEFVLRAGKFFSPDVSLTAGPGLVTSADSYDGKHSFYPFGEAVLRINRFAFVPVEAEWALDSRAAFFPLDGIWKMDSGGSVSTIAADNVFGRDRQDQCIELYLAGSGGWLPEDAPEVLAFHLYDTESRTVRSGYTEDELTLESYVFASAEIRLDFGSLVLLSGFSAIPQVFLFTDAAIPSPGPEWNGNVLDAYGGGLRLKFSNPVFATAALSWGINREGEWRCTFFVTAEK